MRYFIDTEFQENGRKEPIELISIGIVAEDGRELYLEDDDCDVGGLNDWLQLNVVPHLRGTPDALADHFEMRRRIAAFIPQRRPDDHAYVPPQFWGYFADYDWVIFCQIFGTMMTLPPGYPHVCYDVMQLAQMLGVPKATWPKQAESAAHDALADARWTRDVYNFLVQQQYNPRR